MSGRALRHRSAVRLDIGDNPAAWINRLRDRVVVVARGDDRVAVGVDPGHDADMAATAPAHHRDGSDLRARHATPEEQITLGEIAAALVAGLAQHLVHERAAPEAAAAGRIGAEIAARFGAERTAAAPERRRRLAGKVRART